jgi:hypothetical protein
MAELVGTIASALAVTELTGKVLLLCTRYLKEASNARQDIERVIEKLNNLKNVTADATLLLNSPQGSRLHTSQKLQSALQNGLKELKSLQDDLIPSKSRTVMRSFGVRALKWPFKSQDVEKKVEVLQGYAQMISMALQLDHT